LAQYKGEGLKLSYIDVLRQAWVHEGFRNDAAAVCRQKQSAPSNQAEFAIHQDDQRKDYLTCVYLLSNTLSSFQVVGGALCEFERQGSGWGFLSKTYHGTGRTGKSTLKMSVFWERNARA
jgi:hypothetical protein